MFPFLRTAPPCIHIQIHERAHAQRLRKREREEKRDSKKSIHLLFKNMYTKNEWVSIKFLQMYVVMFDMIWYDGTEDIYIL